MSIKIKNLAHCVQGLFFLLLPCNKIEVHAITALIISENTAVRSLYHPLLEVPEDLVVEHKVNIIGRRDSDGFVTIVASLPSKIFRGNSFEKFDIVLKVCIVEDNLVREYKRVGLILVATSKSILRSRLNNS